MIDSPCPEAATSGKAPETAGVKKTVSCACTVRQEYHMQTRK